MRRTSPGLLLCVLANCVLAAAAHAASAVEEIGVDLDPLIDQSARYPERFAVNVPHSISASTNGEWVTRGATRTWTHRVRIPTAVSLSFHAGLVRLPSTARLTVTGKSGSVTYSAADARGNALWGRPLVGDTLRFTLTVNAADARAVRFEIGSLQAGYRGLSRNVPDHPHFRQISAQTAAARVACTQNYSCNATEANRGAAKATVALLIGNVAQCTGTLLNNSRNDGRPYVLTARHCQNGELGGGTPGVASSVTIYWDAVTPCGSVLGSLYNAYSQMQSGAHTVVEQQDAWLIELNEAPRTQEAYFAGWNATGGVFVGGYSVHHALGDAKQYTAWNGQAILRQISGAVLEAPYDSDFWGLVNSLGNVGAGASGGALFDADHHVVGSASLAYLDNTGDGACPLVPPPGPTPSNITALYTALSGVWNSTRDHSSTTGNTTLQTVLAPAGSGTLVLDGFGMRNVTLTASNTSPRTDGSPVTLTWNATWAQSCTATGGQAGDGWAGAKGASGSAQVMSFTGGDVQYLLSCEGANIRGNGSVTVQWIYVAPLISLRGPDRPVMIGSPFELRWDTNLDSCVASDGLSGDGWAGAKAQQGVQSVTATQIGPTTYSLSCGTSPRTAAAQVTVNIVVPSVTLTAEATRLRIGSSFNLQWVSNSMGYCYGSGGPPTWAPNTQMVQSNDSAMSISNVPGIITYTMTCSGGGYTASSSVDVEFVDEPVSLSLNALFPEQEINPSGGTPVSIIDNLAWTSNQAFCSIASLGPYGMGNKLVTMKGQYPAGTALASEHIAGTYQYELWCLGQTARTTITWVTSHPSVTITDNGNENPGTWIGGREYSLWSRTNTLPCTSTGGASGDGWAGSHGNAPQEARTIVAPRTPGTYTYTLTCGAGASVGTTNYVVTVPTPSVTLTATPASPAAGQYITLRWNATVSPCTANANGAGVNWGAANMNYSSSSINRQDTPGTYTYSITCGSGAYTATASTQVTFRAGSATELDASDTNVPINTPVTLSWISGSSSCSGVGGVTGDGWAGPKSTSGVTTVTSSTPQMVGYALNCDSGSSLLYVTYTGVANASPTVPKPAATLTASQAARIAGESVTLTWSSQHANACVGSGGDSGDGWAGNLSLSGTMSVTRATAGSTSYSITCSGAPPASTVETTVVFSAAPGTGSSSSSSSSSSSGGGSSGGGGGGALDRYFALALLLAMLMRMRSITRSRRAN